MSRRTADVCLVPNCGEEIFCKGLCLACYQWDYYHMKLRHGISYFLKYHKKNSRLIARANMRMKGSNVRTLRKTG